MATVRLPILILAVSTGLSAQPADQALTNAQIESMLASGLPESTIVMKIQSAVHFGVIDVDASPAALARLKSDGAGERVLDAVVWAEPFDAAWESRQAAAKIQQAENNAAPRLPESAGVYLKGAAGWASLPSFLSWTPFYSGLGWMHSSHEYTIPLENGGSEPEISDAVPTFYIRMTGSTEGWQMARLTSRKKHQDPKLTSNTRLDQFGGMPSNAVGVQMTPLAGSVFTLRPGAPLEPGAYILCGHVIGGRGLEHCYSFNIRH